MKIDDWCETSIFTSCGEIPSPGSFRRSHIDDGFGEFATAFVRRRRCLAAFDVRGSPRDPGHTHFPVLRLFIRSFVRTRAMHDANFRSDSSPTGGKTGHDQHHYPAATVTDLPAAPDRVVRDLVQVFKLLADETRMRILFYLSRAGELHVRALCDLLDQSQPAVSHHLALMKAAELIELRREGKHNFYRIVPQRFEQALDLLFSTVPTEDRRIRFEDHVLTFSPNDGK